jgi:hypothetical protein
MGIILLLCGCASTEEAPTEVVVDETEAMTHLGPAIRPETLLFPEYLLMPDFQLYQHGQLPGSGLIGIELSTTLDLPATRGRFTDVLQKKEWNITGDEGAALFFRMLAARRGESLEIRGVRGNGPTQVFILYRPLPGGTP